MIGVVGFNVKSGTYCPLYESYFKRSSVSPKIIYIYIYFLWLFCSFYMLPLWPFREMLMYLPALLPLHFHLLSILSTWMEFISFSSVLSCSCKAEIMRLHGTFVALLETKMASEGLMDGFTMPVLLLGHSWRTRFMWDSLIVQYVAFPPFQFVADGNRTSLVKR